MLINVNEDQQLGMREKLCSYMYQKTTLVSGDLARFLGEVAGFSRYPNIWFGGSKTLVSTASCGQALAGLLQDDYKDLGHDNEEKVNALPTFALQFLSAFFGKISIFISIVYLHMHQKDRARKLSKQSGAAFSVLALFFQSSSCCPGMSMPSF